MKQNVTKFEVDKTGRINKNKMVEDYFSYCEKSK